MQLEANLARKKKKKNIIWLDEMSLTMQLYEHQS